jgi:hypothetical protein
VRIGAASGLGGTMLGFIIGLVVGSAGSKNGPAATRDSETEGHVAVTSPAVDERPSEPANAGGKELAVDFGKADDSVTLTGPWTKISLDQRNAVRTPATAAFQLHLSPSSGTYALATIARTDADKLPVGIRVNGKDADQWSVGSEWGMYSTVLDARTLKDGPNSVEFVLPELAKDKTVSFVVDTLHVGPLQSRASADLGLPNPRGALIRGFYGREGEGQNAQSWSAGLRTQVGLLLKPLNSPYEVELIGAAFGPLAPLGVEAFVNGKSIGSVRVEQPQAYVFRAPPDTFVTGFNLVELAYEKTAKPSEVDKTSKDMRDVALRITRVTAKPVSQ